MSNPGGIWSEIDLAGHPCEIFEPDRPSPHEYVSIYLHGVHVNRLSDNEVFTRLLAEHGLRTICPRTGRCWWVDRICPDFDPNITPERYVLDRVLPHVAETWTSVPPRIALLGTSMGGQGALRIAFKHAATFPVVAAISPAIDYQHRLAEGDKILSAIYADRESARQDTATLHVHPLNWPRHTWFACDPADERWYESSERLHMKLSSLGIPHEVDLATTAGGHGFDYYNHVAPRAIGFLANALERERLRVV